MRPHVNIGTQRAHGTLEEAIYLAPPKNKLPFGDPRYPYKEQHKLMSPFDSKGHGILEKSYEAPPQKKRNMGYLYKEQHKLNVITIWTQRTMHIRKGY
jgi:hypothetical protein